jgi:hypothetical protein
LELRPTEGSLAEALLALAEAKVLAEALLALAEAKVLAEAEAERSLMPLRRGKMRPSLRE